MRYRENRSRRTLTILLAGLIAVCAAVFWYVDARPQASEPENAQQIETPFAILESNRVDLLSITVLRSDGERYTLNTPMPEADESALDEAFLLSDEPLYTVSGNEGFRLNSARVEAMVQYAQLLKGWDRIESGSHPLSEFGLENPWAEITYTYRENEVTLLLGDVVPTGSYRYAKRSDDDAVYTVFESAANVIASALNDLHSLSLPVQLNSSYPSHVLVSYADGCTIDLGYPDDESDIIVNYSAEDRQPDQTAARAFFLSVSDNLLGRSSRTSEENGPVFARYIGNRYREDSFEPGGFGSPDLTVFCEDSSGNSITFRFAAETADGEIPVQVDDSGDVFIMETERMEFLKKAREVFGESSQS